MAKRKGKRASTPTLTDLSPRRSERHDEWEKALFGKDAHAVRALADSEAPHVSLFELETFINGIYKTVDNPLVPLPIELARARVEPLVPIVDELRSRLGWRIRDFDLALLRLVRQSSALSLVLGAGASMGAGAPSWSELVRLLLEQTLEKGLELYEMVPSPDNPSASPTDVPPEGSMAPEKRSWSYAARLSEVKRYTPEQEALARSVLEEIASNGTNTDVERLMQGAQVVYDLCGQHLFRLVTGTLYSRATAPSQTHRVIAKLAQLQEVPARRGVYPGWDGIITYNFDDLMSQALSDERLPTTAWAMRGDELAGDPNEVAINSEWHLPVYHLHGYTPRRPFLITHVRFVFSTSQYQTTYAGPPSQVLDVVINRYLAKPVHIALYVGCSFSDNAMNDLLKAAFQKYPGRYHYALLQWPRDRKGAEPDAAEIAAASAKYLAFGVRPVWFDRHDEIPALISALR